MSFEDIGHGADLCSTQATQFHNDIMGTKIEPIVGLVIDERELSSAVSMSQDLNELVERNVLDVLLDPGISQTGVGVQQEMPLARLASREQPAGISIFAFDDIGV